MADEGGGARPAEEANQAHPQRGAGAREERGVLEQLAAAQKAKAGAEAPKFTAEDMSDIKHAYRTMFMAGLRTDEIKAELAEPAQRSPHVKRMLEFFTAQINNDHTRKAYLNAARRFAQWCEAHGLHELAHVQPFHVAAFVKELQGQLAPPFQRRRQRSSLRFRMRRRCFEL